MKNHCSRVIYIAVVMILLVATDSRLMAWGVYGHEIAAQAAIDALPDEMPGFFLEAADQLVWLNPEPDRWRDARESNLDPALNAAYAPGHYLHLDEIPAGALDHPDRFGFLEEQGVGPGLSFYRMLELFQSVRAGFRRWREEDDPRKRQWIGERIVNDAGILGHYITDAANPLHTTRHSNGWVGDNPNGYATRDGIHARFETEFVDAWIGAGDLEPFMDRPARVWEDPRRELTAHLAESFARVEDLYRMDRDLRFGETSDSEGHREFAAARLASGALALRDAWWTAWVTSE